MTCPVCGAKCKDTSKEFARFARRHPRLCKERRDFTRQIAQTTRSVDDEDPIKGMHEDDQK